MEIIQLLRCSGVDAALFQIIGHVSQIILLQRLAGGHTGGAVPAEES